MVEAAAIPVGTDTAQGIINSGESVFEVNGQWVDLADRKDYVCQIVYASLLSELGEAAAKETFPDGASSVKIDNFSVKGYTTPAAIRFAGNNRYDTAAKISSQSGLFEKSDVVFIANATNFADALAGVPLAAAYNAPILLTGKDAVADETAAEIKRLGAGKAIILGGVGAVSEKAEAA
ncbi:MAG: cell wall-binding repeat-containing protein, partial [Ruminococcus sp.]|nr:cell wall-binding repeat-containing protein [Ruminococcus sp.]